jgi:hypothetical protein
VPTKLKELRLARNLDPQKAFAEKRETTVLAEGQSLTIADILTADLETYDSLPGIHALFTTLSHDEKLAKFAWILQWPTLKEEVKTGQILRVCLSRAQLLFEPQGSGFFSGRWCSLICGAKRTGRSSMTICWKTTCVPTSSRGRLRA